MSESEVELEHDELLRRFGEHIARLRSSKGYSQDRLQLESGLARGTVSKIENGLRDARVSTLIKIAHTLGVPPKKILEFATRGENPPKRKP